MTNSQHYHDGPPRHRLQAAATPTTSRNATPYEQALLEIAASQQRELGEIDSGRWNAIAYDYAALVTLPAVGQRILIAHAGMISWASRPDLPRLPRGTKRLFADVIVWGIEQGDLELARAAQTLLRCGPYRALLREDARAVHAAKEAAKAQADQAAAAHAERQNAWIISAVEQATEAGRPADRSLPALEPPRPDYRSLEHYARELATIDAAARAVDAREAQALSTLRERAESLVLKEDFMSVYHSGKVEYGRPQPAKVQDKAAQLERLLAAVVKRRREREQLLRWCHYELVTRPRVVLADTRRILGR